MSSPNKDMAKDSNACAKMCRACCNEGNELKSLYKQGLIFGEVTTLSSMLSYCTDLEIIEDEEFMPASLCLVCVQTLAKFFLFKKMVLKSNMILRKEQKQLQQVQIGNEQMEICEEQFAEVGCEVNQKTFMDNSVGNLAELNAKNDGRSTCFVTISPAPEAASDPPLEPLIDEAADTAEIMTEELDYHQQETNFDYDTDEQVKIDGDDEGGGADVYQSSCYEITLDNNEDNIGVIQVDETSQDENIVVVAASEEFEVMPPIVRKRNKRPHGRHLDPELKCKICGKQLSTVNSFKYHMQLHSENTPFLCSLCGEGFKTRNAYEGHIVIHNPNNPNTCHLCGKSYRQASSLRCHMLLHSGEKPYRCDICGKGMTQKSGYKKHMLVHSGEKPHTCDICGREFRYSSNMIAHRRIHTSEKPYECSTCNKCFPSSDQMKRHKLVHMEERPFSCTFCEKTFKRRSSLISHHVTHTNSDSNERLSIIAAGGSKAVISRSQRRKLKEEVEYY